MIIKFNKESTYDITQSKYYEIYTYYKNGGTYKKDSYPLNHDELFYGFRRIMGYELRYHLIFNTYLVKTKYDGWREYYAPSKMALRDNIKNIIKIIELN